MQGAGAKARVDAVHCDRQTPLPLTVRGVLGRAVEEIRLDRPRRPQIGDAQADQTDGRAVPAARLVQRPGGREQGAGVVAVPREPPLAGVGLEAAEADLEGDGTPRDPLLPSGGGDLTR